MRFEHNTNGLLKAIHDLRFSIPAYILIPNDDVYQMKLCGIPVEVDEELTELAPAGYSVIINCEKNANKTVS